MTRCDVYIHSCLIQIRGHHESYSIMFAWLSFPSVNGSEDMVILPDYKVIISSVSVYDALPCTVFL